MGKEDEKKKKDKDKDKKDDKHKKDSKDKDKKDDKHKKDSKDKDKKDKDKDKKDSKDKDKKSGDDSWKIPVSGALDNNIAQFEKITNKFRDIDNYILKDASSKEDFIKKVNKLIEDLPEGFKQIFLAFLNSI